MVEHREHVAGQRNSAYAKVYIEDVRDLTFREIVVFVCLGTYARDGFAFPSPQTIANETTFTLNVVYETLKKLTRRDKIEPFIDADGRSGWLLLGTENVPFDTESELAVSTENVPIKSRIRTSIHYRATYLTANNNAPQAGTPATQGENDVSKIGPISKGSSYPAKQPSKPRRATAPPVVSISGEQCAELVKQLTGEVVDNRYWDELITKYGGIDIALDVIRQAHAFKPSITTPEYPKLTSTAVLRWANKHYVKNRTINAPVDGRTAAMQIIASADRRGVLNERVIENGFRMSGVRREDAEGLLDNGILDRVYAKIKL